MPHTWGTTGSHNKFYIICKMGYISDFNMAYNCDPLVSILAEGKYTGANLAPGIQGL